MCFPNARAVANVCAVSTDKVNSSELIGSKSELFEEENRLLFTCYSKSQSDGGFA